jgi:hypothetical protein
MILGQGGVKMILVDIYDHKIHFCRREMLKRNIELIL